MQNTQNINYSFTRISGNSKTGPIPVSMTSRNSCPDACALKGSGCYAESGMVRIHWQKLDKAGISFNALLMHILALPKGQLWRHNVAGDLASRANHPGLIDSTMLEALVKANKGRSGFAYTHHVVKHGQPYGQSNRETIRRANLQGFTVNLSANSPEEADELAALGIGPVVTLLEEWQSGQPKTLRTPNGRHIVVCPAVTTEGVTCQLCRLCANADRASIVGFPVHGVGKNKARKIISISKG
jgi:hypothetical protein